MKIKQVKRIRRFEDGTGYTIYNLQQDPQNNKQYLLDPNTGYFTVKDEFGNNLTNKGMVILPELNVRGISPQTQFRMKEDAYRSPLFKEYTEGTKDARNILEALSSPFMLAESGAADLVTSLSKDMFTKESLKLAGKALWDNKWNISKNFLKGGIKGGLASAAGNTVLGYTTGYTAPQIISEATGLPEGLAEWMDPFFLYGASTKFPGEKKLGNWLKKNIRFPSFLRRNVKPLDIEQPVNESYKSRVNRLLLKMENGGLSMDDLVDKDGNIVDKNLAPVLKIFSNQFKEGGSLGLGGYHPRSGQTTLEHLYATAESAKRLQQPKGVTKQQLVFEALTHDIGEFIDRNNHPAHSKEILLRLFPKIDKPVLEDVAAHMNTAYGTESQKALHAADVITGGDVEQMLDDNPLINYGPYVRNTNIGRPDIKNLPTSELISRVNEWLKMRGLPQIDTSLSQEEAMLQLRNTMTRYRTVMRGVSLKEDEDGTFGGIGEIGEYATNFIKKLMDEGKTKEEAVDEFFKHIVTATPEINTKHGKMGLYDFLKRNGFSEYTQKGISRVETAPKVPGKVSLRKKASDSIVDPDAAIYTSNSTDVARGYASGGTYGDGYYAEVPEQYDPSMTMIDYVLANDFPLYDTEGKLNKKYDFDIPYKLLTSKSERDANLDKIHNSTIGPDLNDIVKGGKESLEKVLFEKRNGECDVHRKFIDPILDGEFADLYRLIEPLNKTFLALLNFERDLNHLNKKMPTQYVYSNRESNDLAEVRDCLDSLDSIIHRLIHTNPEHTDYSAFQNNAMDIIDSVTYFLKEFNSEARINGYYDANRAVSRILEDVNALEVDIRLNNIGTEKLEHVKLDVQDLHKQFLETTIKKLRATLNNGDITGHLAYIINKLLFDPIYSLRLHGRIKKPIENFLVDVLNGEKANSMTKKDIMPLYEKLKNEPLTKDEIESINNMSDTYIKHIRDYIENLRNTFLEVATDSHKKELYKATVKETFRTKKIYPMHQTVEANRHPKAFTTESFNESDGHQHYVFTGKPGKKILVNPRKAGLKTTSERNTHHYGRLDPNATTKLFSITAPVIATGAALKNKKNK